MTQFTTNSIALTETAMVPIIDQSQLKLTLSADKTQENTITKLDSQTKLKASHDSEIDDPA